MASSQDLISSPLSWSGSDSYIRYYAQYKELVLLAEEREDGVPVEDLGEGEGGNFEHDYYSVPDALDHIPVDRSNNIRNAQNINAKQQSLMSACARDQQESLYLRSTILSPLKTKAETLPSIASKSCLLGQQHDNSISDNSPTQIGVQSSAPHQLTSLLPQQSHQPNIQEGQGT